RERAAYQQVRVPDRQAERVDVGEDQVPVRFAQHPGALDHHARRARTGGAEGGEDPRLGDLGRRYEPALDELRDGEQVHAGTTSVRAGPARPHGQPSGCRRAVSPVTRKPGYVRASGSRKANRPRPVRAGRQSASTTYGTTSGG